jgi:two-component system chemotaxis sensor kinase CheA
MEIKYDYLNMIEHIENFKSLNKLGDLRREIHTYKGLFAQKEMLNVVKKLHDFESIIDVSITKNELNESLVNITSIDMSNWLDLDINIVKNILGDCYFDKSNLIPIDKDRIKSLYLKVIDYFKTDNNLKTKNIIKELKEFQYHNIKIFFRPYEKLVEQLSVKLNKSINPLLLKCEDIYASNEYQPFLNSLVHIFRNSVDHGIEIAEDRLEAGKEANGTIVCDIFKSKENLNINIYDDGNGINIETISSLAIEKGIYTKEEILKLNEQDILLIIFQDAFSTSDTITDISGRGVGLASILSELNKLNGTLVINNDFGSGIEFKFTVPLI